MMNRSFKLNSLKFISKYLIKIRGLILLILFITILSSLINLIIPYITKQIFDSGVMIGNIETIVYLSLALLGLYIVKFFINYLSSILYTKSSVKFTTTIKKDLYSHLLHLPMRYFDKNKKGYLLSRIDEADSLSILFSSVIFNFLSALITALGAFYFIINKSSILGGITLIFIPVFYVLTHKSLNKIHLSSKELFELTALTKGKIQESIEGIHELKHLNNEEKTYIDLSNQINDISAKTIKRGKLTALGTEAITFTTNISQVLITLVICIFIVRGNLSVGDYVALTQYILMAYAPVQLLASFSITIQPGIVALQRISSVLEEELENRSSGIEIENIEKIEFKNVSFRYNKYENPIFSKVNFTIKIGENVVLEGANGSGKSTLVKLLLGLYTDYNGTIKINDIDLKKLNIKTIRDRIGIISQTILLFSGTLLDNIKMANPNISDEKLEQLFKIFNDKIFNNVNPHSLRINEKGNNLSGGQRQKIALLRVFAKNPDIIILDEATSNLDDSSKNLLFDFIQNICDSKLCIIISHEERIKTLANSIIEIKAGTLTKIET
ncbi:ABC transporter ATP-binding protein [Salipaludibacillus sp. HK11]|uniref:ABC transporter ATP-binding protein n=1 Tax=Salipaludibacillus sp. HK11 TaxID=3394320 RepID=UPI0039FDC935